MLSSIISFITTLAYYSNSYSNSYSGADAAFDLIIGGIEIIVGIFMVVCLWIIYNKADRPGWAAIIPIYDNVVLYRMVGLNPWWLLLLLLPCLGWIVVAILNIVARYRLAACFGKDSGFGIGLVFLPFVFLPILAFGDAQYQGYEDEESSEEEF